MAAAACCNSLSIVLDFMETACMETPLTEYQLWLETIGLASSTVWIQQLARQRVPNTRLSYFGWKRLACQAQLNEVLLSVTGNSTTVPGTC